MSSPGFLHLHAAASLGQKVSAESLSIVFASDASIPIALSNDTDYGVVGASTLRTAAQLGNATGAADFNAGNKGAQTLRVVIATDQTAIPASQSGTWNITNISGTVSLPTGAATEATLSAASAKLPATLGQKAMAASLAVAIASDQSAIPVSQSGTWNITNISGTISLPTGAATESTLAAASAKLPATLGQKAMAASLAVVIASDQSAVPASQSGTWNITNISGTVSLPTGAATAANQSTANTSLSSIDTKLTVSATGSNQKVGSITGSSLTGTYATVVALTFDAVIVQLLNSCDNTIKVSLDGGTTDAFILEAGESVSLDLGASGRKVASGVNIQAKHNGAAPTAGTIRATVIG